MFFENQILHGDCTHVLRELPSRSVDLVLTDPPYGVQYRDREGRRIANDNNLDPVLASFPELFRVLKPDTFCISFYGWNRVDAFFRAWRRVGFVPVGHIVFHKTYSSRRGFLEARHEQAYLLAKGRPPTPAAPISDVRPWEYSGNRAHPTEKAVSILIPLIESFSQPDQLVLDPFSGSGSTSLAAAKTGRRFLGIELDAGYCAYARSRLTGFLAAPPPEPALAEVLSRFALWMKARGTPDSSGLVTRTRQSIA